MALVTPPSPHNPHHPDLYIANTYHSLMMVDRMGSVTTPVSTHVEGKLILFANELDIHKNESIFFTNTNMRYNRRVSGGHQFRWIEICIDYQILSIDKNGQL
ncbi:hypothetical protein QJS04_geneDACA025055 [Acorus gramineus]|uniref:Adipocyte plasma membrane-associated protein n=1 Tax=Acorus gramineus TaxID=55184 RepID=A0AAV9A2F6_ACOGR|nr:hypothetical protein QJS04_geneDACA025055 [Acorus gramineus]